MGSDYSRRLWLSEISLLERVSGKFRRCWKILSPIFRQHKMLSLPRFLAFSGKEKWLLENRPRLRERCWIFFSETATAFLSSSDFSTSGLALQHARWFPHSTVPLTLQPLLFFFEKKSKGNPEKSKGLSLRGTPEKSLEKKGRTHKKKARKIGNRKKQGNRKKARIGGVRVRVGFSGRTSGKTPEMPSERFLEFPLARPNPYNSRHLKPLDHLPSARLGDTSFFSELVPERTSPLTLQSLPFSISCFFFCFPIFLAFFVRFFLPFPRVFRGKKARIGGSGQGI